MRFAVVWVAFCCWAPVAAAQVSFTRHDAADEKVARALEQLLDQPVEVVPAAVGGEDGARVSVDRARAVVRVVTKEHPAGLSRSLDPSVVAGSPYAVALAAAELLELSKLAREAAPRRNVRAEPPSTSLPRTAASGGDAEPRPVTSPASTGREASASPFAAAAEPPAVIVEPESPSAERAAESAGPVAVYEPEVDPQPIASPPRVSSERPIDASTAVLAAPGAPHPARSSGLLPDYAFGIDLELQSQLAHALSFVRPAAYGELSWGRETPGMFGALGARVSAPLRADLQPSAANTSPAAHVAARSMDAALQGTLGLTFGALAIAAHLAVGMTYLRVEALDAGRSELGADEDLSPLVAAGVGARVPVAFGFALALRGEAQWAGPGTVYRVDGQRVLEADAFRVGMLAGILWESAIGRGP